MELLNETRLAVELWVGDFPADQPCVTVIIKGTFDFSHGAATLSREQLPVLFADTPYERIPHPSAVLEGDLVPFKPRADVVLLGKAYAPGGKPCVTIDAQVRIGKIRKTIRVVGDRQYRFEVTGPVATPPTPFETMDLVYERAYGGSDQLGGAVFPKNRVGRGFFVREARESMHDAPLPNLENPTCLIKSWRQQPDPEGFGFYPRNSLPRFANLGTVDDEWTQHRAPQWPTDFRCDYYNGAHPDLQLEGYLSGTEEVELTNLTFEGRARFRLPGIRPQIQVSRCSPAGMSRQESGSAPEVLNDSPVRGDLVIETIDPKLDTLVLLPEERRFYMVWRGGTALGSVESLATEIAEIKATCRL